MEKYSDFKRAFIPRSEVILSIVDLAREVANDPAEAQKLRSIPIQTRAEVTELTRQRQSEAKKAHWTIPTYRAKIAKAMKGKKRPNVAHAVKAAHANSVKHARMIEKLKSPEHRQAVSERMKKLWSNPVWVKRLKKKRRDARMKKTPHPMSTLSGDMVVSPAKV